MRISAVQRTAIERVSVTVLVVLSAAMIILAKADQVLIQSVRSTVMDGAAPALDAISRPATALVAAANRVLSVMTVYRDNVRLTEENERLLGWQQVALRLSAENAELRELTKLAPEPPISFVTARVIADSGGAYARSVMVDAGSENGVARGEAAMTGEGLAGRVSEVGTRAARVLLITDLNSRVPVVVDGTHQRAILAGDNSARPSLRYRDADGTVRIGDRIITSGEGGVFPPGLPVGVVASVDGEAPRVEPYAALSRLDYLRLVDYGLAEALPTPLSISGRGGKRADYGSDGQRPPRR
ncbi:MAG: rod shape-determining protein MreC [Alphaproteobacteria bacterium]|nr:rod shape-determining protein MreC [Alphaproteobacteria bacterium]